MAFRDEGFFVFTVAPPRNEIGRPFLPPDKNAFMSDSVLSLLFTPFNR